MKKNKLAPPNDSGQITQIRPTDAVSQKKEHPLLRKLLNLVFLFFIVSILGWCIEKMYFEYILGYQEDRGFLSLPYCIIYGVSIVIIYLLIGTPQTGLVGKLYRLIRGDGKLLRKILGRIATFALYFVAAVIVSGTAEFITALLFDKMLGVPLWDYSYYDFNIMGYVCLEYSVYWGALITLAMSTLWHLFYKVASLIPFKAILIIDIVFAAVFLADILFNFIYLAVKGKHFDFLAYSLPRCPGGRSLYVTCSVFLRR